MRATIIVAIYGVCAVILLTFYSVHAWLDPFLPVTIGAIAVVIPAFAIVLSLEPDARPPRPDILMLAQTALLAALFGLMAPALWSVPAMRMHALDLLPSQRSVEGAMDDAIADVAVHACTKLFDPALDFRGDQITEILSAHEPVVPQCLNQAGSSPMLDDATAGTALAWHQSLTTEGAQMCPRAAALDLLPIPSSSRVAMLLDCSLRAEDATNRNCCAERLTAVYQATLLEEATGAGTVLTQLGTSAALLAVAFDEKGFVKRIQPIPKQLGLQSDGFRNLSIDLSCAAVVEEASRPDDMQYLEWLFAQNATCLDGPGTTDVIAACAEFQQMAKQERNDLAGALCRANKAARTKKAERAAAFKAGVAFGGMATEIDSGQNFVQGEKMNLQNYGELLKSGEFENLSDADRAALLASMQGSTPGEANKMGVLTPEQYMKGGPVNTPEAREKMELDYQEKANDHADVETVMGVKMSELSADLDKEGELSPEMTERLQERAKRKGKGPQQTEKPEQTQEAE